jgi:hypothetical protein
VFHHGDRLLIDRDVLSCGPTPRCDALTAWCEVRRDFWNSLVPGSVPQPATDFGLLTETARLQGAEPITIWAATGVSEQLFIAHVLHRAEELGVDATKVRLVQFETLRGRRTGHVLGTGMLSEQDMSEHPEPAPISASALRDYRAAWTALTSPDPVLIERFGESHPGANDWLKRAMRQLLRRFPDSRSGLPWWDFRLLAEVRSHGPRAVRVIGHTMGDCFDEADLLGDYYLFGRLLRLGDPQLRAPLLQISGDRTDLRDVQVALSPFGLDVLEGKTSSYPTNAIDDWASGVKLSSAEGVLWFNEGGRLVI